MNFQRAANGSYTYARVGQWNNGSFVMRPLEVVFAGTGPPESVCSDPCPLGYAKVGTAPLGVCQGSSSSVAPACLRGELSL